MNPPAAWHTLYPYNVPREIDASRCFSLVDLFTDAAANHLLRPAFGNFGSYLTYEQTQQLAQSFAGYLLGHCNVPPGARVAVMLPNVLAYPIAMLGTLMAGATVVNVNPQYTARELKHQLCDSGATTVIILRHLLPVLDEVVNETAVREIIVAEVGDLLRPTKKLLINSVLRLKNGVPKLSNIGKFTSFKQAIAAGKRHGFRPVPLKPEDLAFLQYTGGTTGLSKGAMLSHGNVIANVMQISAFFTDQVEPGKEIVVTALPLYHIYALTFNCFCFLHHGGLIYLITDPRNVKSFIKEIRALKFTAISGVNTLYNLLLSDPEFSGIDFSRLKYASSGGMAAQRTVAEKWQDKTNVFLGESYGLTEASPAVTSIPPGIEHFTGTVGVPLPSTECSIRDEQGETLPTNEIGELWVRGPQVMQGYWGNEQATADAITTDGWLRTGDMAAMDDNGMLRIVDRAKDMIIVSGFNVYPNEVEDVAAKHPDIVEVAVIGLPDEVAGEMVTLVAVASNPELTEQELIDFCRQDLTAYKKPSRVIFVDELPKSNVGKILRREVREMLR
ncbi:MAG: AMP-binding protein [Gammaproteobacteria bacterium]